MKDVLNRSGSPLFRNASTGGVTVSNLKQQQSLLKAKLDAAWSAKEATKNEYTQTCCMGTQPTTSPSCTALNKLLAEQANTYNSLRSQYDALTQQIITGVETGTTLYPTEDAGSDVKLEPMDISGTITRFESITYNGQPMTLLYTGEAHPLQAGNRIKVSLDFHAGISGLATVKIYVVQGVQANGIIVYDQISMGTYQTVTGKWVLFDAATVLVNVENPLTPEEVLQQNANTYSSSVIKADEPTATLPEDLPQDISLDVSNEKTVMGTSVSKLALYLIAGGAAFLILKKLFFSKKP